MEAGEVAETPTLGLANMAGGAAEELFQNALKDLLRNMQDPNTDWKAKRNITLKFDFAQSEDRRMAGVALSCSTKMPGVKPVSTVMYMGLEKGELAAVEAPRQSDMFQSPAGRPRSLEEVARG